MKILIENTIEINGMGHPETKTIFNIENEMERGHFRFKPLTSISGRKLSVSFKYTQDTDEFRDRIMLTIPTSTDENVIKDYILTEINNYLNQTVK
jgi:hypothetical protein